MSNDDFEWRAFLKEYGYYAVTFELLNGSRTPALSQLAEWMRSDTPRYTGWSPFWWPTRAEIAPTVVSQDTYECLHDGTGITGAIERWRASVKGWFAIIRPYDSDRDGEPGNYLELTMPAWRIAAILLYAGRMAHRFEADTVDFTVRFEGLKGRVLRASWAPSRSLFQRYTTEAARYERRLALPAEDIDTGVVEMTDNLVRGLFELFQFPLPDTLCEVEIARMRSNRY